MLTSLPTGLTTALGPAAPMTADVVTELFAEKSRALEADLEGRLGRAGFYGQNAEGLEPPTTPLHAPPAATPPVVTPVRDLWMASFTPGWQGNNSDVHDEDHFPWSHPETAAELGNDWLSTDDTPANRNAIEAIRPGDLVIIQRTDPGPGGSRLDGFGATSLLVGAAIAGPAEAWTDPAGRRQRRVHLIPATRFRHLVPRSTAKSLGRITGGTFTSRPQRHDGTGGRGRTLSAVPAPDALDLLAVSGIHPQALAEPDVATLIARLRSTETGDPALLAYRYDHVLQNDRRRVNEQRAIAACRAAIGARGWAEREDLQRRGSEGCDLLLDDGAGTEVRVEVKGYVSRRLADVHLQPSQADAARAAAARRSDDWWLYTLLDVESAGPVGRWHAAADVAALLASGGIQERRMRRPR